MSGLVLKNLMYVEILSTGTAFPSEGKWVSNEHIHELIYGSNWMSKMIDKNLDPSYYERELGFKNRFWVHTPGDPIIHGELTSADLMIAAAKDAIAKAGISKDEIDFVITVTITSPRYSTSMGAFVAGALEIKAPAMEMKSGCASNVFSITLAAQLIQGGARNVLITCGETNTKILKLNANMPYAGGDAGSAIILSRSNSSEKGIIASYLNTDGAYSGHMGVPGLMPPNQKDLDDGNYFLSYSDGAEEFLNHAWNTTPEILYKHSGIKSSDIDCFIPHQVHKKRTILASKAADVSMEKTIHIIENYANCGSSTLLLAIDSAKKNNYLKHGHTSLIVAAGGGISWGGIILKS
jgi:3-oxoacyl-[acyl-carrier-protein] synthase III